MMRLGALQYADNTPEAARALAAVMDELDLIDPVPLVNPYPLQLVKEFAASRPDLVLAAMNIKPSAAANKVYQATTDLAPVPPPVADDKAERKSVMHALSKHEVDVDSGKVPLFPLPADLVTGLRKYNPDLLEKYCQMEREERDQILRSQGVLGDTRY